MSEPTADEFDHEAHMRRAFELAREAVDRGDRPFGTVLVRDETVVMADSNRVITENDIRRHPELHLAHRACRELESDERAEAARDTIVPSWTVDRLVSKLDDVERLRLPVGHFDVYRGDGFERVVDRQLAFLERTLVS